MYAKKNTGLIRLKSFAFLSWCSQLRAIIRTTTICLSIARDSTNKQHLEVKLVSPLETTTGSLHLKKSTGKISRPSMCWMKSPSNSSSKFKWTGKPIHTMILDILSGLILTEIPRITKASTRKRLSSMTNIVTGTMILGIVTMPKIQFNVTPYFTTTGLRCTMVLFGSIQQPAGKKLSLVRWTKLWSRLTLQKTNSMILTEQSPTRQWLQHRIQTVLSMLKDLKNKHSAHSGVNGTLAPDTLINHLSKIMKVSLHSTNSTA